MKPAKNSDPQSKTSSPKHSSQIHFSPRGDAFKNTVDHFDVAKIRNVSEALEAFNYTSFQSRLLGRCYKIWMRMLTDPDRPLIFFGLSGAMIAGGMRRILRDMIAFHAIDVLVSTGANLSHDLYESLGGRHYIANHHIDDPTLREMRIDRVYDTYADDVIFTKTDEFVEEFADSLQPRSIGMALTVYRNEKLKAGQPPMIYDPMVDNLEIMSLKRRWTKSGVIFLGGGTPKNYIQQVIPMSEIAGMEVPPHSYAIQVTTDDAKFGGLSGCELPESQSWGKLDPKAQQCTVHVDGTIGLPLLFTGIMEHYEEWKNRGKLNVNWGEALQTPPPRINRRGSG